MSLIIITFSMHLIRNWRKRSRISYNGEVSGAWFHSLYFYEDTVFWQNVYDNQHYLKAVQPNQKKSFDIGYGRTFPCRLLDG